MTISLRQAVLPRVLSWCAPLVVAIGTIAASPAHAAPDDRRVGGLAFEQAPAIDGRLDDAVWQGGTWCSGFSTIKAQQTPARAQTRFKIGSDAHMLYIGAIMDQPPGAPLVNRIDARDGAVWRDDAVEIMIAPAPTIDEYIHLVVNSAGVVYDALQVQGGQLADRTLNMAVKVATHVEEGAWSIELAIPFADLGLSATTTPQWAVNIARVSHAPPEAEVSSYVPMQGTLHQPRRFATLQLTHLDTSPFQWAVASRDRPRVVADQGRLFLETKLIVANETGRYEFFDLGLRMVQGAKELGELQTVRGLDAGASRIYDLRIPYEGEGEAVVDVTLHNKRADMPVRRHQYAVTLNYTPLQLSLSAPAYRDSIYATQTLDAIRGVVAINLSAEQLAGGELEVSLLDDTGQRLGMAPPAEAGARVDFEIPLSGPLPPGAFRVVAKLTLAGQPTPHQADITLHRLPPPPAGGREVRLNEHRVTLVDGEPFLPYGSMMLRPQDDLEAAALQGYTAVFEYAFYWWDEARQRAWLDRVHANGLMAVIYPYPEPAMTRDGRPQKPLSDDEAQKIRTFILRWKDHPALLAWYLADEPELHAMLPERIAAVYELCRETDPYHPAILLNNTTGGIDTYGKSSDILMPNPFPGFYRDGGPRRGIRYAYHLVRHAAEAVHGTRGTWTTPQAFSWADLRQERSDERIPTFREVRNMNYQAVIAGATGSISYAYAHGRRHPSIRLGQAFLAAEMQLLKDAVLAIDTAETLKSTKANDQVLHSFRTAGGNSYLFIVNVATESQEVAFILPDKAPSRWHVVSEGRSIELGEGRELREVLDPLETRIYTTESATSGVLSLARMQSAIDQAPTFVEDDQPLPRDEIKAATDF